MHKEIRGLHEAAYLLAFFTFGSQIFALVRDRLLAHRFGAGETLDLFYAAFRVPDTLYALIASMVSLFVLIPFLERASKNGEEELKEFFSSMFTFFSFTLIVLAGVASIFAHEIVSFLYSSLSEGGRKELVPVIRILLLQPVFLGVSNLFAAYVQVKGRFLLYALAPILYNIGMIIGILFLEPFFGLNGLAWGVVLGAILHLGVQTPFVVASQMTPRVIVPRFALVREVIQTSIPRTIALSMQQIVMLLLVSLATRLVTGSVSAFTFAWNLQAVPLAIIGVSYSVAAFPKLSKLYSNGEIEEYVRLIQVAARQIIFWALPTIVFFVVLRAQIVRVILGTGAFNWNATKMTAAVFALLTISLVAQGLMVLLVRALYAAGKTMIPFIITTISSLVTIFFAYFFLWYEKRDPSFLFSLSKLMRVSGLANSEILLLALAYSIGSFCTLVLLLWYFSKTHSRFLCGLGASTLQALVSSLVAGYATYIGLNLLTQTLSLDTFWGIFFQGLFAGLVGLFVWIATLVALQSQDIVAVWETLQKKIRKKEIEQTRASFE